MPALTTTPTPTWPPHRPDPIRQHARPPRSNPALANIGAFCTLTGLESDQMAEQLAQFGWLEIIDSQTRTMILTPAPNSATSPAPAAAALGRSPAG